MSKHHYVYGNWKMNHGPAKAAEVLSELEPVTEKLSHTTVGIAAPAVSLPKALELTTASALKVGSQNVHWEESGAFTGEISVGMLQEIGCDFTLTGHSERRHIFGETDQMIAKRTIAGLSKNLEVVFCVGELLEEREAGKTTEVLQTQIGALLPELTAELSKNMIIAYEPVWAIGTGKVAGAEEILQAHKDIVDYWAEVSDAPCPPILYGGSVSPDNFAEIIRLDNVSGALVGGASLVAEKFSKLIAISEEA
jgi:triosephosphate isomerase